MLLLHLRGGENETKKKYGHFALCYKFTTSVVQEDGSNEIEHLSTTQPLQLEYKGVTQRRGIKS